MTPTFLSAADATYPTRLRERFGADAPEPLATLGNLDLLGLPQTALFSSTQCPGHAILTAYDQAARWRDEGRCIISGFHSPVEQECLRILLRGNSPIIICPARGLPRRLTPAWQEPLATGRLLLISPFAADKTRVTAALATRRNEFVAALTDEVWFAHVAEGGQMQKLVQQIEQWSKIYPRD